MYRFIFLYNEILISAAVAKTFSVPYSNEAAYKQKPAYIPPFYQQRRRAEPRLEKESKASKASRSLVRAVNQFFDSLINMISPPLSAGAASVLSLAILPSPISVRFLSLSIYLGKSSTQQPKALQRI